MDEDYHSYDYDDSPQHDYDFAEIYASEFDYHASDAQFEPYFDDDVQFEPYFEDDLQLEPYFDNDHASGFNHHIDVEIEGRDDTVFIRDFEVYIGGGNEGEEEHQFGLGGYDAGNDYEGVHVGGPVIVEWGNQSEEDDDAGDEDESLSLTRLLRDGITALIEQIERATVEPLESRLNSVNWTIPSVKSWPFFRSQFNVSPNSTPSSGAGNTTGSSSCPICMEHWTNDGEHSLCSLPCGHLYGMSCIKRWLQQQNPGECPQCKKICKLEDVRRLYGSIAVVDKHLEERIRFLEAKCASLELKDLEWKKKEAEWRQREADLSRQQENKEKVL